MYSNSETSFIVSQTIKHFQPLTLLQDSEEREAMEADFLLLSQLVDKYKGKQHALNHVIWCLDHHDKGLIWRTKFPYIKYNAIVRAWEFISFRQSYTAASGKKHSFVEEGGAGGGGGGVPALELPRAGGAGGGVLALPHHQGVETSPPLTGKGKGQGKEIKRKIELTAEQVLEIKKHYQQPDCVINLHHNFASQHT